MAMTLRLTEGETELLRAQAEREHRSMHEVARLAILERIGRAERQAWIETQVDQIMVEDAELLRRLAQ